MAASCETHFTPRFQKIKGSILWTHDWLDHPKNYDEYYGKACELYNSIGFRYLKCPYLRTECTQFAAPTSTGQLILNMEKYGAFNINKPGSIAMTHTTDLTLTESRSINVVLLAGGEVNAGTENSHPYLRVRDIDSLRTAYLACGDAFRGDPNTRLTDFERVLLTNVVFWLDYRDDDSCNNEQLRPLFNRI